ncbi:hypothetical protein GGI20_000987 [Coemansia sp. BCRC 34301]|nr:hypothetical protein GGI20_000987 [Coemansia sp. BCRC 34301]
MGAVTTLPLARKLVVVICECREKSKRLHDTGISNALEFAQLLKSFVLSETATELSCSTKLLQTDVVDEGALALFMQAVYQGTQRPLLVLADMGIQHSSIFDGIPSLTSLWIGCQVSVDLHSSLIHRSAATLQSLEVSLNDANLLLCNADGAHIVYPNLHHLSISHCTRADTSNDVMGRPLEFVPFPALKRLTVNHVYPFDDDVVFRGNNATLKHLKFSVSVSTVKMLNRCKVFRDSRDGVLRKVTMTECRETPDIGSVAKADIDMLLDDVLGTALSIVLSASIVHSASIASLHGRRRLENVGVLEVRTGKVSLFTVLSLLRALPRLIRISCCISGLGAELDHIPAGDLANHVVSEYGNAARGLREWTMGYSNLGDVDKTPQYVLLLALVSPIFFCQKVAKNPGSKLSEAISAAIGTKPYTKHASRLREQLLPK